jgi:hypothetical protein
MPRSARRDGGAVVQRLPAFDKTVHSANESAKWPVRQIANNPVETIADGFVM